MYDLAAILNKFRKDVGEWHVRSDQSDKIFDQISAASQWTRRNRRICKSARTVHAWCLALESDCCAAQTRHILRYTLCPHACVARMEWKQML